MSRLFIFTLMAMSGFLWGCNESLEKNSAAFDPTGQSALSTASYESVQAKVFTPYCVKCHGQSAGVNLETYANVLAARDRIAPALSLGIMPPRGTFPPELRDYALAWLELGAPEAETALPNSPDSGAPDPTPAPGPTPPPIAPPAGGTPDYASVRNLVFAPYCLKCHAASVSSGGVNLETYASTHKNLSMIEFAIETDQMPLGSSLPADLKDYLLTWVKAGGPEFTNNPGPTPTPAPTPVPIKLAPNYESLKANIFAPKCLACHSAKGMANHIRFDDYQAMRRNTWLFDQRRPRRSEIIEAVTERPDKRMPPLQSKIPPLNSTEVETLVRWIELGLPER